MLTYADVCRNAGVFESEAQELQRFCHVTPTDASLKLFTTAAGTAQVLSLLALLVLVRKYKYCCPAYVCSI
jgi:hypothetical protein